MSDGFETLGLKKELLEALTELGYEEPTPVQSAAIPLLVEGKDVLGQAATGTGKTAAFALPLLQRIKPGEHAPFSCSALVVVPTRELAMQVAEAVHRYGRKLGVSVLPVYGGQDIGQQLRRLKRGVDVVIATPGRALDHVRRKTLKLGKVEYVVLDEADEMLDLGFADDLEALLSELPEGRQTALFSATLPPRIAAIAEEHLRDPSRVRIEAAKGTPGSVPKIRQTAYVVPRSLKEVALGRIFDVESPDSAIVFCRTRLDVEKLTEALTGHGYDAESLHGGMTQEQRDRVLRRFKAAELQVLVATDVAARGLDVEKLTHVINYDLPTDPSQYVHRIGRTGRAGREGVAISLLDSRELRLLQNIERLTRQKVEVAQLPTVIDLRSRRMDMTRATIEEALKDAEANAPYRTIVEQLAANAELMDVATAAVALLHEGLNPGRESDEVEIPAFRPKERGGPPQRAGRDDRGAGRGARGAHEERGAGERRPRAGHDESTLREDRGPSAERGTRGRSIGPVARIFVGVGRSAGVRPGDLVGAIANEAGLNSSEIGAIQIADHHSFVEVAAEREQDVLKALRGSTIRGRRPKIGPDLRGSGKARPRDEE